MEADRGRVLHLQEHLDEALEAYDVALQLDPGRQVVPRLGICLGLAAAAVQSQRLPGRVEVLRWRGEVLLALRRYPEAAAAFDAYLDRGGTPSAAVYRQRGLAQTNLGRHAEAIDDYGRALDAGPKDEEKAPLHLYRGQEHLATNALQQALRDFERSLHLNPNNPDACLGCAHVWLRLDDPQKGVSYAEQAVRNKPTEPRLWLGAARVCAQAAAQLQPGPGRQAVQALLRARYQEQAVAFLRTALNLVPAGQRPAYWREQVRQDPVLNQLRAVPGFAPLAAFDGPPQ
jgi:tetratricopeptide (TPR) repeat protein